MQTDAYRLWSTRIVTFAISALAAASAAYWGLKAWAPQPPSAVPAAMLVQPVAFSAQAIARALGGGLTPAAAVAKSVPLASRYALVGVVAGRSRGGAALISVDGQDAKTVRVGNPVDEGVVLESVSGRQAVLASTANALARFTLELPPLDN